MPHERRSPSLNGKKIDARVAELAAAQWGVVDVADLRRCGLSAKAIHSRVRNGRLFPLHRGVYAVGHPKVCLEGRFLAAVKACGPDAVLSHYSAAVLWGLLTWFERFPEVTATAARRHEGIRTYRTSALDRTVIKGIPVTPPARTIADLSATLPLRPTRRAVNEAFNQRLITPADLLVHDRPGAKQLRKILLTAAPTRNEYEDLVLHILDGLPRPLVNQPLPGTPYFPDLRWPEHDLILEADSRRFHDQPLARADDAHRQRVLEAHGQRVIRTTWTEATTRPDRLRARVQRALALACPPGALKLRSA